MDEALARQDLEGVTALGLDECSKQTGHQYLTTFCGLNDARVQACDLVFSIQDARISQVSGLQCEPESPQSQPWERMILRAIPRARLYPASLLLQRCTALRVALRASSPVWQETR